MRGIRQSFIAVDSAHHQCLYVRFHNSWSTGHKKTLAGQAVRVLILQTALDDWPTQYHITTQRSSFELLPST